MENIEWLVEQLRTAKDELALYKSTNAEISRWWLQEKKENDELAKKVDELKKQLEPKGIVTEPPQVGPYAGPYPDGPSGTSPFLNLSDATVPKVTENMDVNADYDERRDISAARP
jgi:hypothetical protein